MPPRDWRKHGASYISHGLQGAVCGVGLVAWLWTSGFWVAPALTWSLLYVAYQGLSFARRRDTVGRDMFDFMLGAGLGLLGASGYGLLSA